MPDAAKTLGGGRQKPDRRRYDKRRGSAHRRGYDAGHRDRRGECLARADYVCECSGCPVCVPSLDRACASLATVADHIIPHRGDKVLLESVANYQALCESCHNRKTKMGE